MTVTAEMIARVCHEANRAYCQALGDHSHRPWDEAPAWQRQSALLGVRMHLGNPDAGLEAGHESWMRDRKANGWHEGPVKDEAAKIHPCMVPFGKLPPNQQAKDYLFRAIVHAFVDAGTVE